VAEIDPNYFRGVDQTEARRLLTVLDTAPEAATAREAFLNKNHPRHAEAVEHRRFLHQVAAGEPAPLGSVPAPLPREDDARAVIRRIDADPAFRDRNAPMHSHLVEQRRAAFQQLYPGDATTTPTDR
jgi:hypothetical protein